MKADLAVWGRALLTACACAIISERVTLWIPLVASLTASIAKTGIFGGSLWALTTSDEDALSKRLLQLLSHTATTLVALALAAFFVCWPVMQVKCEEAGTLTVTTQAGIPSSRPPVECVRGKIAVIAKFGVWPSLLVEDAAGLRAVRELLPLETNAVVYPNDFKRDFHVLLALDANAIAQVPEEQYALAFDDKGCRAHFCVHYGDATYNLTSGGLLLGSATADEQLLNQRCSVAEKADSQPPPVAVPRLHVTPDKPLAFDLYRQVAGKYKLCGPIECIPRQGKRLCSVSSIACR